MKDEKLMALKKLIIGLAAYYGHPIDEFVVGMYAEDLLDLPLDRVFAAAREIRLDPKITRFPLPAVLREKVAPRLTEIDLARDLAARILNAIGRHGHNWSDKDPAWPSQPIAELGQVGFQVVQRYGGWVRVCELSGQMGLGIFMAQLRDLVESVLRASQSQVFKQGPALSKPASESQKCLERLSFQALLRN